MKSRYSFPRQKVVVLSIALIFSFRMLGLFMIIPVLALQENTYQNFSPFLVGLALGSYGLTQGLLQIPFGILSDRYGRKKLIYFGLILFTIGSLMAARAETLEGIILGRAFQGAGAISGTLLALLADFTGEKVRSKAMAFVGGFIGMSFMLGMILGPLLSQSFGMSMIFKLTAFLGLAGIMIMFIFVPERSSKYRNLEVSLDSSILRSTFLDTNLMRLNLSIFMLHFLLMSYFVILPVTLIDELGHTEEYLPFLYFILSGGGFFVMLPFMIWSEKFQRQRVLLLCSIGLLSLTMFLMPYWNDYLLTMTSILVFFSVFNLLEALLPSWISKLSPPGRRGSALSLFSTCQFLGTFFGGLLGGFVIQEFNSIQIFSFFGSLIILWFGLVWRFGNIEPLQTIVLDITSKKSKDLLKIISKQEGIEDILITDEDSVAYVKINKVRFDFKRFDDLMFLGDGNGKRN